MKNKFLLAALCISLISISSKCSKSNNNNGNNPNPPDPPDPPVAISNDIESWLTKANREELLKKQTTTIGFTKVENTLPNVYIDEATTFQTVDGFGYSLTGGSAELLHQMNDATRAQLLKELFDTTGNGIGVSYLRVSIGASDLDASVFSYNDLPAGETDPTLSQFSINRDLQHLVPVLKEILSIQPNIKIMGSPWSPPVWMKTNQNSIGGKLKPEYYSVYAQYFVKYIQAMKAQGITIDAITVQNEPHHDGNNPSLKMEANEQADFVKNHLGPAFETASIKTKIIIWDHNCDNPDYPIQILNDANAKKYIDGSAFHLYAGDISAMSKVHQAHPDKNLYFTEQWTSSTGDFGGDFRWHIKNVIIGSMKNWSKTALEWNLANDVNYGPHTPGGCTQCKGAITINGNQFSKNVAYYIVAQASKFIPPGSVRISSSDASGLTSVAFKRPDGKKVMIVLNEGNSEIKFNIKYPDKLAVATIPAASAVTYIW